MDNNFRKLTFPALFNETLKKYGDRSAYAFVGEKPRSFNEAGDQINSLISFLEQAGIVPGDRVAIFSLNMPNWSSAFFAITCMGAVVVPILPDFSTSEVQNILEHSEAKAIFISSSLLHKIDGFRLENLKTAIHIEDYSVIYSDKHP